MTDDTKTRCPACDLQMVCPSCDDTRPVADDLYAGWQIVSPFNRWETVTRVERPHEFGPVIVHTDKTGDQFGWTFFRTERLTAIGPLPMRAGEPQIRIVEYDWADGPMYALATTSTAMHVSYAAINCLVEARHAGRGKGWVVTYYRNGNVLQSMLRDAEQFVRVDVTSKAKARVELARAAREIGKLLNVKVVAQERK